MASTKSFGLRPSWSAAAAAAICLALAPALVPARVSAASKTPSKPGNFRVTATTPFTATVAWSPAGGAASYVLASTGYPSEQVTLPASATSFTFTKGLAPRNTYWFMIQAVNSAGNASTSIGVSATLPPDVTPPSAPVLSVSAVGSTYVSLAWTAAQDDGPYLFYQVLVNGAPYGDAITNRSITVHLLEPQTAYTFQVRTFDYGRNSALSNAVNLTTAARNPNDVTPPTTPGNLSEEHWDTEVQLSWNQSTDDFDPQGVIRYDVYVNGVLSDILFGSGGPSIVYGARGQLNTIEVVAIDSAGNASEPATLTISL